MAGLHHPHIVRLLGYCEEHNPETLLSEQLLVYEFMPNGDLEAFIQKSKSFISFLVNIHYAGMYAISACVICWLKSCTARSLGNIPFLLRLFFLHLLCTHVYMTGSILLNNTKKKMMLAWSYASTSLLV